MGLTMGGACCSSESTAATHARSYLDERFGHGTADAFQRFVELLSKVELKMTGSAAKRMSHPFMVNLGMVLKQAEEQKRYVTPMTSGVRFEDAKVLKKAARYARYAAAAFYTEKRAIADYVGGLCPDDIKHVHMPPHPGAPAYFVSVDPESGDVVLCIRGASSAAEALSGAVAPKEALLGGRAHAGMLDAAKSVVEGVVKIIMQLSQESPRKGIAIVGHSVGGGVAALTTILLSADGCPFAKLMAAGKVKCYAFAPPPTFEPLWALPAWVHGSTYSFVFNMDCVPRTCLGTVAKLYLALKDVDQMPLSIERRLSFIRDDAKISNTLPDFLEIPQDIGTAFSSLFAVGTIVLMYKGEDGLMRCEAAAPHMTDRILLHPDLLHDHSISCYMQAFDDLRSEWASSDKCVIS